MRMHALLDDLYRIRILLHQNPFANIGSLATDAQTNQIVGPLIIPENNLKARPNTVIHHGPFSSSWELFKYFLDLSHIELDAYVQGLQQNGRVKASTVVHHRKTHYWLGACAAEYVQAMERCLPQIRYTLMHTDLDLQNIYVDDQWRVVGIMAFIYIDLMA